MFSSSSIDLISSNETLNHENEVFKSNLDPIVENSQNSTKNRKTSVITSKIETFENIMRNSSSSVDKLETGQNVNLERNMNNRVYNIKKATQKHYAEKSKHTLQNRNTSDNGFSSSSGCSDYSYGVSAAVVMPRDVISTKSQKKPRNYS